MSQKNTFLIKLPNEEKNINHLYNITTIKME